MRDHSLTQADVAKEIGVSQPTVSRVLKGKRRWTRSETERLKKLLGARCDA